MRAIVAVLGGLVLVSAAGVVGADTKLHTLTYAFDFDRFLRPPNGAGSSR